MPGGLRIPAFEAFVQEVRQRLDNLERRLHKVNRSDVLDNYHEICWFEDEFPATGRRSSYIPKFGGRLYQVVVSVNIVGSTATVVKIFRNAVEVGEVTLPAGQLIQITSFDIEAGADQDALSWNLISLGTSARDLGVQFRFR